MFISPPAWLVLGSLDAVRFRWSHVPLLVELFAMKDFMMPPLLGRPLLPVRQVFCRLTGC